MVQAQAEQRSLFERDNGPRPLFGPPAERARRAAALPPVGPALCGAYADAVCPYCDGRGLRYHAPARPGAPPVAVCVRCGRAAEA